MATIIDCLDLITATKESAIDPESAYVLRTRLKRSLMSVAQFAASRVRSPGPIMPDDIAQLDIDDPVSAALLRQCTTLMAKTHTLCQPSEALDSRWQSGWGLVLEDLDILEKSLKAMIVKEEEHQIV